MEPLSVKNPMPFEYPIKRGRPSDPFDFETPAGGEYPVYYTGTYQKYNF
jgi:hypothetical protein